MSSPRPTGRWAGAGCATGARTLPARSWAHLMSWWLSIVAYKMCIINALCRCCCCSQFFSSVFSASALQTAATAPTESAFVHLH
jgi:hypothetical protein